MTDGKERSGVVVLAMAAVLSVLGVVLLWPTLGGDSHPAAGPPHTPTAPAASSATPTAKPKPPPPASAEPSPSATTPSSPSPSVSSSPDGDALAGEVSDAALQHSLEQSRQANIPPTLEKRLVDLGGKVLLADVTGEARKAFPDYFKGQPATDRWRKCRIRAGVAERYDDRSDAALIHLVWAGTSPDGVRDDRQPATVLLVRADDGTWWPKSQAEEED